MRLGMRTLIFCLIVLAMAWSPTGAYDDWTTLDEQESLAVLDELLGRFEKSLDQATQAEAAHPRFLEDLTAILEGLRAYQGRLVGEGDWGDYEPTVVLVPRDRRTADGPESTYFHMRFAPAATFPLGIQNNLEGFVDVDFWIAETPVTYELWHAVRVWALESGYSFSNVGREGSAGSSGQAPSAQKKEPVTNVNWLDAIVWCNALSDWAGIEPTYWFNGAPLRTTANVDHLRVDVVDLGGYRLPTADEWELAARYRGSDSAAGAIEMPAGSDLFWTPGSFASGATDTTLNAEATAAAGWYGGNSAVGGGSRKTQPVGQKPVGGNGLGLYDMSGNVAEWCFTLEGERRITKGGSWGTHQNALRIGESAAIDPSGPNPNRGFRIVRTEW